MATLSDDVFDGKNEALRIETASPPAEDYQTAWQCIRANPKIALWTLWANSEYIFSFVEPDSNISLVGSVMIGYENLALSVCLAMPAFQ